MIQGKLPFSSILQEEEEIPSIFGYIAEGERHPETPGYEVVPLDHKNDRDGCASTGAEEGHCQEGLRYGDIETEQAFGNDVRIVVEEFCNPVMKAGLLKTQHMDGIFLNIDDLPINSTALLEKLQAAKSAALQQGDEDLLSVDVGKVFMEAAAMLPAFKNYCV